MGAAVVAKDTNGNGGEKSSLVSKAYGHIREGILSGRYAPNASLRLQALASEIGVSIIPVREALRQLEAEHLVQISQNRGAQVAPLALEDVQDAYSVRIVLEVEALRRSFPRLTTKDVRRARALTNRMMQLMRRDDEAAFEAHRELHFVLYEKAGSPWMLRMIDMLWGHTERYRRLATVLRGDAELIGAEHSAVVDAIEEGNKDAALSALQKHLERTTELLSELPVQTG